MTPDEIRSQRFEAQLLRGFNSEEVLAFLEDVAEAHDDLQKTNRALTGRVKVLEAEILARADRERQVVSPPEVLRDAEAQAKSMIKAAKEKEAQAESMINAAKEKEAQAESMINAAREKETPAASRQTEVLRAVALKEVEALLHDAQAQAQALIDGAREREAAALADVEAARTQQRREAEALVAEERSRAESLIAAAREQETAIRNEIERLSQRRLQLVDEVRTTLDTYDQWLETVDPRGRAPGRREPFGTSNGGGEGGGSSDEVPAG
jgi:DivIVA domain-containing protein